MTKNGSEGACDCLGLRKTITKPIPSSASYHFCLRLFEWSQKFLRDLPVCGGRTWVWDHTEISDTLIHYVLSAKPLYTCLSLLLLFAFVHAFLVFVDCFIHFRTACMAQKQLVIFQYFRTWNHVFFIGWLNTINNPNPNPNTLTWRHGWTRKRHFQSVVKVTQIQDIGGIFDQYGWHTRVLFKTLQNPAF